MMKTVFFESLRYKLITKKWFLLRLLSWYSYNDSDSQKENQLLLSLLGLGQMCGYFGFESVDFVNFGYIDGLCLVY